MRLKWRNRVERRSTSWSDQLLASGELASVVGGTLPSGGGSTLTGAGGAAARGGGGPGGGIVQIMAQGVLGSLAYDFVKSEAEGFVQGMDIGLKAIGEWLSAEAPVESVLVDTGPPPMDAGLPGGVEQQNQGTSSDELGSMLGWPTMGGSYIGGFTY